MVENTVRMWTTMSTEDSRVSDGAPGGRSQGQGGIFRGVVLVVIEPAGMSAVMAAGCRYHDRDTG